jgi:hypothetical protein
MKFDKWVEKKELDEAMGFVQKLDYQDKGQKPPKTTPKKDTKLTQSVDSPKDIKKAIDMFMKGAQKLIDDDYKKNYTNLKPPILSIKKGGRYYKVIRKEQNGSGTSVHAFIDAKEGPTLGDVLKPASWKAPAKHARGNVFDGSWGLKYMSSYGPAYLK